MSSYPAAVRSRSISQKYTDMPTSLLFLEQCFVKTVCVSIDKLVMVHVIATCLSYQCYQQIWRYVLLINIKFQFFVQ